MKLRPVGLGLVAAAAALYLGAAVPAETRLKAARQELADLQRKRDEGALALGRQHRREEALLRVSQPAGTASPLEIRRRIVATVDMSTLAEATVDVRPGSAPAAAVVHVRARGAFVDLMGLAGRLADPASGVILQQARLSRQSNDLILDMDGEVVEAQP
jgi:hypothetical protein